jgi:hypothetical protein
MKQRFSRSFSGREINISVSDADRGLCWPVRVMDADECQSFVHLHDKLVEEHGYRGALLPYSPVNVKGHLLFKWMHDLVTDPRIVDAVQQMLGSPNVLALESNFLVKTDKFKASVPWHRDETYD